jgi:hypothetical protein
MPEANMVTQEAYSHEVISFGFWFGDDKPNSVAAPAFYSYTTPEPTGLADEPLSPESAKWVDSNGAHLALLMYDDVRAKTRLISEFLQSAYEAGAKTANWPLDELAIRPL